MKQTGDRQACRPELEEVHLYGPAARWASEPEEEEQEQAELDRQRQWHRRIAQAHAQALEEAVRTSYNESLQRRGQTAHATTATELWSPRETPLRRRRSFRSAATPPRSGSKATAHLLDESNFRFQNPTTFPGPPATMMEMNVVPSVVLHFHGFRSSLLSNLWYASCRILVDMAQRSICATLGFILTFIALLILKTIMLFLLYVSALILTTLGVFLALEGAAVVWGNKQSELLHGQFSPTNTKALNMTVVAVPSAPTLPRLNVPASIAVQPTTRAETPINEKQQLADTTPTKREGEAMESAPSIRPTPPQLSAVRRRVIERLRAPPVIVNRVPGERRRRADVCLHNAKIRVGKAYINEHLSAVVQDKYQKNKPQDIYMVRIDCSKPDDKHMNPVVMWDITATFEEFRKIEKDLRAEVKAKRLRNVTVPHLSSGAILFVQPTLNDHVLNARRDRLQKFIDQLRQDPVLADLDAMRKFCQAF